MSINFSALDEGSLGIQGPYNSLLKSGNGAEGPEKVLLQEGGNKVSKSDA